MPAVLPASDDTAFADLRQQAARSTLAAPDGRWLRKACPVLVGRRTSVRCRLASRDRAWGQPPNSQGRGTGDRNIALQQDPQPRRIYYASRSSIRLFAPSQVNVR